MYMFVFFIPIPAHIPRYTGLLFPMSSLAVRAPHNASKASAGAADPESVAPARLPGAACSTIAVARCITPVFFSTDFGCPIYNTHFSFV